MIDFGTLYLFVILSIFCACVVLIAVSCFWECFKEEIMQARLSKHAKKVLEIYRECEPLIINDKDKTEE